MKDILTPRGIVVFTVEALGKPNDTTPPPVPVPAPAPAPAPAAVTPEISVSPSSLSYALQSSGRIAHSHEYITRVVQEVDEKS